MGLRTDGIAMQTTKLVLGNIHHNPAGFNALLSFFANASDSPVVEADMQATSWFDADMCAPFGALIKRLEQRQVKVKLINLQERVKDILLRNGFLAHLGGDSSPDPYQTTIAYQEFSVDDEVAFSGYIGEKLVHHRGWPKMPTELSRAFRQNVCEVFSNAVNHSDTKLGVFSCGQFYPNKNHLNFTIADLGVGIQQKIKTHANRDCSSVEAINWATKGYTTKPDSRTGGMGLKTLCRFLDKNEGVVRIVSDDGYWQRNSGKITSEVLFYPFPGTVVNLEINTADTHSWGEQSDLDTDNPF